MQLEADRSVLLHAEDAGKLRPLHTTSRGLSLLFETFSFQEDELLFL
jgi:hypothetical protein